MAPNLQILAQDSRYFPSLLGFFSALILLLFVDKIPTNLSQWLLPSLIVYSIGAGIFSFIHVMLWVRSRDEVKIQKGLPHKIPELAFWILMGLHVLWFVAFIFYGRCKGII